MTSYQADPTTAKKRLRSLIEQLREKNLSVHSFCGQFEHIYNLELDQDELSEVEAKAFRALFEKVVWHSPFEDERREIPNYLGDEEIVNAVREAEAVLGQ